jgi:hypothetical protein
VRAAVDEIGDHFTPLVVTRNHIARFKAISEQGDSDTLALVALKKIIPAASEWKSREQLNAVKRVLTTRQTFLLVLPTGGGKSLVFLAFCATFPEKLAVVFCPTAALQKQFVTQANVFVSLFSTSDSLSDDSTGLVVLLYANLEKPHIRDSLMSHGHLERVFVDEVDDFLGQSWNYPKEFLPQLRTYVPMTFMTATAPVEIREKLSILFFPTSFLPVIAAPIVRPNLHLEVRKFQCICRQSRLQAAVDAVEPELRSLKGKDKAILFVSSRTTPHILKLALDSKNIKSTTYCGVDPKDFKMIRERELSLELWRKSVPVMCSSPALSMGIDCPTVALVVAVDFPFSLEQMQQMFGRAGRDGSSARCILLYNESDDGFARSSETDSRRAILEFAKLKVCRNLALNATLSPVDNPDVLTCITGGFAKCDNCLHQRRAVLSSPAVPLLNEEMRHEPTDEDLRVFGLITNRTQVLRYRVVDAANLAVIFQGICAICYFATDKILEHRPIDCKRKTGSCLCCFGLLLPEVVDHFANSCPFNIRTEKHCYVCWFPKCIDNQTFHPRGNCNLFSLKLWHIQDLIKKHGKLRASELRDICSSEIVLKLVKRFRDHFTEI